MYWLKRTPWDTGITPPEVVDLVARRFPKGGRAIDIGCGTGTTVVYLARHGFRVIGIDVSRRAIALARRRVREAGVSADLLTGDVTRLDRLPGRPSSIWRLTSGAFIHCRHTSSKRTRAVCAIA